jgi:hypothetical protein
MVKSLYLIKRHAIKAHRGVEVWLDVYLNSVLQERGKLPPPNCIYLFGRNLQDSGRSPELSRREKYVSRIFSCGETTLDPSVVQL